MNLDQTLSELTLLPVSERLRVVESLWDSIDADSPVTISPDQRAELNRRIAAHQGDPDSAISYDELKRRLKGR